MKGQTVKQKQCFDLVGRDQIKQLCALCNS